MTATHVSLPAIRVLRGPRPVAAFLRAVAVATRDGGGGVDVQEEKEGGEEVGEGQAPVDGQLQGGHGVPRGRGEAPCGPRAPPAPS